MRNPMSRWALAALLAVLTFVATVAVAEAHGAPTLLSCEHSLSAINHLQLR
jgi:hypothetical protein